MHDSKKIKKYLRPKGISDLDILWAIRDIPRSILNSSKKGILAMLIAIIGNRKYCEYSQSQLEDKLGSSKRTLQDQLIDLEALGFITIIRPAKYNSGEKNSYKINYKFLLSEAKKYADHM